MRLLAANISMPLKPEGLPNFKLPMLGPMSLSFKLSTRADLFSCFRLTDIVVLLLLLSAPVLTFAGVFSAVTLRIPT